MSKWFRFIRKGHLMMATIRAMLKLLKEHDQRTDKALLELTDIIERVSKNERATFKLLELQFTASLSAKTTNPKPNDGVVKSRSWSQFSQLMSVDKADVEAAKEKDNVA